MILTREQAIAGHRKMWNWIADETLKRKKRVRKREYFEAHLMLEKPINQCYCCEYNDSNCSCNRCVLDWHSSSYSHGCIEGIYGVWLDTDDNDYERLAELARQIANLPEKVL